MEKSYPVRKPLRIKDFDYNTPGAYFVTFCTHNKRNILSQITEQGAETPVCTLMPFGIIVDGILHTLPHHLQVRLERYVIMPNHLHLLLVIECESKETRRSILSKTVGYIKMNAARRIHEQFGDVTVWQRGYHDHVIRNEQDYRMIAEYIDENPLRWKLDQLYRES